MGQFSVEISALPGSILNGNQQSEDWQPYALELVEDGLNALRKRLD